MKPSQVSSSPSAPASSTPPVSPTITQASSRRSTPSPSDSRHEPPRPPLTHLTSAPRSLPTEPPLREEDSQSQNAAGTQYDTETPQTRPSIPSTSRSAPIGKLPRLLQHDKSRYTDSSMPMSALTQSSTSLYELAQLIRHERYQTQRRSQQRVRLHRSLVSATLSSRLLHCGKASYRALADYFRSNDLSNVGDFAKLYKAIHDVKLSDDAMRRYALVEPDSEPRSKGTKIESTTSFVTFMHEIPQKTRTELLTFISEIRTNPKFLASRIASLTNEELAVFTNSRPMVGSGDSVLASGRGSGNARMPSSLSSSPPSVHHLLSFHRHDPLSTLLWTIFANSSSPDSSEDLRRTDAWATTCAHLISEDKVGGEALVRGVLDAYAGMRDWPAKANLELFLMDVLQEGHFILEGVEGTNSTSRDLPDPAAARVYEVEEFYNRCLRRLFDIIDGEPNAGGMPEGIVEIASAILKRMGHTKRLRHRAEKYMLHRWFFQSYLANVLMYPESHGMMVGHHIPKNAREKILREIALRMTRQVHATISNVQQAVHVMPEIENHLTSLLNRLRLPRLTNKPVLQPAKVLASPRDSVEVQPFIVVCPSDIITLVNCLFPDSRPASKQADASSFRGGLGSAASSISSIPFRTASVSTPGDGSSVLSMSASSITSGSTSQEPLLDSPEKSNDESEPTPARPDQSPISSQFTTEEYGRRIRIACSEMQRNLGYEACSGTCHPYADNWAILYVSTDGKTLRPRMSKDVEDDDDTEEDTSETESDDEDGQVQRIDLESDYHMLKESIVKLLQEYEVPWNLGPDSELRTFNSRPLANKAQRHPRSLKRADMSLSGDETGRSQGYSQSSSSHAARHSTGPSIKRSSVQQPRSHSAGEIDDGYQNQQSDLIRLLDAARDQCEKRGEYIQANEWFNTIQQLYRLSSSSLTRDDYAPLLNYFARGPRDALSKSFSAIEEFDAWFAWLEQSQERYDARIDDMMVSFKNLRDKMWYRNAVMNSAVYEEAKNVMQALKRMGQPTVTADGRPMSQQRPRQSTFSKNSNFLLKTESQMLDIMAANSEITGPNKLADEQSDMTLKWLAQYGVENFCKGEERIHRFCLEIDKCVNKLIGDGVLDAPVLWSSELYRVDKKILDSGRQKGDLYLSGVGTLSIASDEEYEIHSRTKGIDFLQKPSQSSLRSISTQSSQQSFASSFSAGSGGLNILDMPDYFNKPSTAFTIDETKTFYDPLEAQANSPTSPGSLRPSTSSSSRGTVMLKNSSAVNEDKRKFLLDLKQILTGLLLSDLGTRLFWSGSETDAWFSGDLGEECIQRKEADERRRKQKLARKKSMKSLKSARDQHRKSLDGKVNPPLTPAASQNAGAETQSAGEHSTSSSDATAHSSGISAARRAGLLKFPYDDAFRHLLRKFATHPNPFAKLHALYELEILIVSSLSNRSGRHPGRSSTLPTVPQSPTLGAVPEFSSREAAIQTQQPQNIEDAIANVAERRSHNERAHLTSGSTSPSNFKSGTRSPTSIPSTDTIIEVLQSLFRDADIRPKTLFRDLQYIAAFVPAQMLDKTERGKAFWDAGLAALSLKQDVCRYMIEIADEIVADDTDRRPTSEQPAPATAPGQQPPTTETTTPQPPSEQRSSPWTMADAARMFIITAKEGDAVAERELAIFYLTHPDLLQRTVSPLSRPKDIFKAELMNRDRKRGDDLARTDPITMCVAQHWMEQSKMGGDDLATKYLRTRDDIERIP